MFLFGIPSWITVVMYEWVAEKVANDTNARCCTVSFDVGFSCGEIEFKFVFSYNFNSLPQFHRRITRISDVILFLLIFSQLEYRRVPRESP